MFTRNFEKTVREYRQFPAIAIQGPRQSGKTTLAKAVFPSHVYISFEDPDTKLLAQEDPRQLLKIYENEHGIIIDEFQYVPQILSYIQLEIDTKKRPGYFILTGSQNFLMNAAITQSLAGRIAILTLLPLSVNELAQNKIIENDASKVVFNGGYPRIYDEHIAPQKLYPSYIQTYIERDVRQLINVGDLGVFTKFLKLCAGRVGQMLNLSEIAGVCGISATTAERWISVLEASYILYRLQPYFNNYNKRLTKSPKLYFYDTGLACSLLDIESPTSLALSPFYGSLFECFIISDISKQYFNAGKRPSTYFWRDLNGRIEVDCIIEQESKLYPIEIKSGQTIVSSFFDAIEKWRELANVDVSHCFLIYGGDLVQERSRAQVIGWKESGNIVERINKKRIK
jgi:hypothetical protein